MCMSIIYGPTLTANISVRRWLHIFEAYYIYEIDLDILVKKTMRVENIQASPDQLRHTSGPDIRDCVEFCVSRNYSFAYFQFLL